MIKRFTEIEQLSYDIYKNKGNIKFNDVKGDEAIKKMILDSLELSEDFTQTEYKNAYRRNKAAFFEITEQLLNPIMGRILTDELNHFVDVEHTDINEQKRFTVTDSSLFRVGVTCDGNIDVRRQTVTNGSFVVQTRNLPVRIYLDINQFLAGQIDWVELCERVQKSYVAQIQAEIAKAMYGAFGNTKVEGDYFKNGTFDEQKLLDLISNVEMDTNTKAGIYGTKKALAKVKGTTDMISNEMKNEFNLLGQLKSFQGTPMHTIPQARLANRSLAIPDNALLIVPEGQKIVKVVLEGDVTMFEDPTIRNDEQIDFLFKRKAGVGVAKPAIFGEFLLS